MAMTDKEADRLFDSILLKLERKLGRQLITNFSNLTKAIKQIVSSGGEIAGNIIIQENQRALELILIAAYEAAILEGVKFTRRDLEEPPATEEQSEAILLFLFAWIISTASVHSQQLTHTTIDILNRSFEEGARLGLAGDDLDKFVTRKLARLNRNRVPTIALTEAGEALSMGSERTALTIDDDDGGRDIGAGVGTGAGRGGAAPLIRGPVLKRWRSQEDRIVRNTHARANAKYSANPIPIEQNFQVGSSFGAFPRASTLSMAERINCRCFARYTRQLIGL